MNEQILKIMGFSQELTLIKNGLCPICKQQIGEFRDELSRKEFQISGMCQMCQDSFFDN